MVTAERAWRPIKGDLSTDEFPGILVTQAVPRPRNPTLMMARKCLQLRKNAREEQVIEGHMLGNRTATSDTDFCYRLLVALGAVTCCNWCL